MTKHIVLFVFVFGLSLTSFSESVGPQLASSPIQVSLPSQTVQAAALPATPSQPVSAPIVPPPWLEKALNTASSMPVIGPIVVEVAKWLGVIASVLTLLVTFLMGLMRVLLPVLNYAKLASLAVAIEKFQGSSIMYWLKFFSMYNAKKEGGGDGPLNKTA